MRAVAVGLVVLFHAGVPQLSGGYVGVDVFYVISGFLITGLLVREWLTRGSISIPRFYARRARRILPAGTLVLIVTVLASYQWLGFLRAGAIAEDGQWTALFAANIHFALEGTQYLNNLDPPSPLQHYWSLGVEEQFYLVWPVLFIAVGAAGSRRHLRKRLSGVLGVVIVASLAWSIIQTPQDGNWAFFSPLTRVWELAIGAVLAVGSARLRRVPERLGPWLNWGGLGLVVASALIFNTDTRFPGYAAVLPVTGAALVIAGGTISPTKGVEAILGTMPFQWIGKLSYSLYLWHWPVLTIAAEATGTVLTLPQGLGLVAIAVLLSAATYSAVEDPVRRSKQLNGRVHASLVFGVGLVAASYFLCTWEQQRFRPRASTQSGATISSLIRIRTPDGHEAAKEMHG